ncbi:unnamed protein product [Adineta ricciae]|uniref:Uncharacterized protein n=1 Tax=Adineta ricciae TaxID=249248 RepID=A0A815KQL7_ADIRI|nr:unnamed protein product [Adineta ricciae]
MAKKGDKKKDSKKEEAEVLFEVGTGDMDVYENLRELQVEMSDLMSEYVEHVSRTPFIHIKGKYFTMQQYYAWEYRLRLKKRIYSVVYPEHRRVYIYSAGTHPKEKVPKPPKAENIAWSRFQKL